MNRRGFLSGLLALGAAPAIIRTPGLLMPVRPERLATRGWRYVPDVLCEGPIPSGLIRSEDIRVGWISASQLVAGAICVEKLQPGARYHADGVYRWPT